MIRETAHHKLVSTDGYNMFFNKHNGKTYRWGKTHNNDPQLAPLGIVLVTVPGAISQIPPKREST
jgi:hypothetical protein